MHYTVKKLSQIAGVSIRTLHWYDQVGLLKPAGYAPNGYRYYEEEQLLVMQQIMFFKELGFTLADIQRLIAQNSFDKYRALYAHKRVLENDVTRINKLIATVDKTILYLAGKQNMSDQEFFQGFGTSHHNFVLKGRVQDFLKEYSAKHRIDGTIHISVDDTTVAAESFSNLNKTKQHNMSGKYMIGLVTMQFTAVALLKAIYDKEITKGHEFDVASIEKRIYAHLHETLANIFPGDHMIWAGNMPKWANVITLHHLLANTSGIPSVNVLSISNDVEGHHHKHIAEVVSLFKNKELDFEPGSNFAASNSGYILLGALIEQIVNKPLDEYMQTIFFETLCMDSTILASQTAHYEFERIDEQIVSGYKFDILDNDVKLVEVNDLPSLSLTKAASGIITTAADLIKWNKALYSGQVIPEFLLEYMLKPHVNIGRSDEYKSDYGYGTAIVQLKPFGTIYMHNGFVSGHFADLVYIPTLKLSLVCLSNVVAERAGYKREREIIKNNLTGHSLNERDLAAAIYDELCIKYPGFKKNQHLDAFPRFSYDFVKELSTYYQSCLINE